MKGIIFAYAALIIAVIAIVIIIKPGTINLNFLSKKNAQTPIATISGKQFNLILAKTEKEQMIGLSGRNSLDSNSGMLFVFNQKSKYPFWMRNMKFPIDIIFINDNEIVEIFKDLPPAKEDKNIPVYAPKEEVNYVLEINAGLSSKYNFKAGEKVEFKNL